LLGSIKDWRFGGPGGPANQPVCGRMPVHAVSHSSRGHRHPAGEL